MLTAALSLFIGHFTFPVSFPQCLWLCKTGMSSPPLKAWHTVIHEALCPELSVLQIKSNDVGHHLILCLSQPNTPPPPSPSNLSVRSLNVSSRFSNHFPLMTYQCSWRPKECILLLNPEQTHCIRTVGLNRNFFSTGFGYILCIWVCQFSHQPPLVATSWFCHCWIKAVFFHGPHGDYVTSVFSPISESLCKTRPGGWFPRALVSVCLQSGSVDL